jgi:hypothetical protein
MLFKDAVKYVHPDLNPTLPDAPGKLLDLIAVKNDSYLIDKLLSDWGIVVNLPIPTTRKKVKDRMFCYDNKARLFSTLKHKTVFTAVA